MCLTRMVMNRRGFLKSIGAASLGSLAGSACHIQNRGSFSGPVQRPNILLIYTDDQRFDALGVVQQELGVEGRFPWLRTPNLDRLAKGGLRFRQAFVVNSICSPSRACTLTGLYSHHNGVRNNFTELPPDQVTVAAMLQKAGYATGYFGKWHMAKQSTRPGFDTWASYIGQGWFQDCHLNVNGQTVETKGWVDEVATDYALNFMKTSRDKPFFAVLGFKAPHTPYIRADGQTQQYDQVEARPVPSLGHLPGYFLAQDASRQPLDAVAKTRDYFRMLDGIDRTIGRLLDGLEQAGLATNTVICFTSDNGYFLGEHGVDDKRLAYEESIRVPLIVHWPDRVGAGQTTEAMALNIDFAPTFLELAGAPIPASLPGRSLLPAFRNPHEPVRDFYFYEYFRENAKQMQPDCFAIRTRHEKLIHYPENPAWDEMFDLRTDPYEMNNRLADPTMAEVRRRLEKLLASEARRLGAPGLWEDRK